MVQTNKIHFVGWALSLSMLLFVGGCASYKASRAYDKAEQLSAEDKVDAAVESYSKAAALEPSSKKYKIELLASKTKAANSHVNQARKLTRDGRYAEALYEYRAAQGYDSGLEVINQEEKSLRELLEAQRFAEEGADLYNKKNVVAARKAIEQALRLNANNARALAIKELLDSKVKNIAMDGIELDVSSTEPITLSFKDANIKEVFGILSKLSGINFIFDEDIRSQSISVLLEKASFAQAMELILQMNGLEKKVLNSKTLIIFPQSREKEKQYGDQIIQIFYLSHIDAKKAVNLLRTMLQLRKVYVHEERNALVVRDKPEVVRLAAQILEAADRGDSEVLFDLELVSVSSGDALTLGPKLSVQTIGVGMAKDAGPESTLVLDSLPAAGGATLGLIQSLNGLEAFYTLPSAQFDFIKTLNDTDTLANPKIRVKNNEKAKVHVGTREPVVTVTTNNTTTTDSIQYVDVGIKLDVEPSIQLDGTVLTMIKLEVSSADYLQPTANGTTPIRISTTNAETKLVLKDGVRTVIGGLFEKSKTRNKSTIPFLGDIPILGALFTNFNNNDSKREILLSITPHIIRNIVVPGIDVATIWSGGEDNLKDGPNFGAFAEPFKSEIEVTKPLAAPAVKPQKVEQAFSNAEKVKAKVESVKIESPESNFVVVEEPVSAESPVAETAPFEAAPVVDTSASVVEETAEEPVPTEVMANTEELGGPTVLEVPKKAPASIHFSVPEDVEQGKDFTVAVEITDAEMLYSAPLFVKYDPELLELVSINEGDFLRQDGQSTIFSNSPNRSTGQVIVGYKQSSGGKGASGSGTLFTMSFKPLAAGETELEVNRINFRDPEGVRLQVVSEAITIGVR